MFALLCRQVHLRAVVIRIGEHIKKLRSQQEVVEEVRQQIAELHPATISGLGGQVVQRGFRRPIVGAGKRIDERPEALAELLTDHRTLLVR